jgi:hypothetical protein
MNLREPRREGVANERIMCCMGSSEHINKHSVFIKMENFFKI